MAKKIKTLDEVPVNAFDAIKTALKHKGLVRKKPKSPELQEKNTASSLSSSSSSTAEENIDKLIDATEKAHEVLFKADTVFPFVLFPDTVTLDREKLTIATRYFYRVAKINSTPVRDILSVEADVGPFFGSIHVSSRYFVTNPYSVSFLWRKDALALQRLLQGYIIVHEQKIDASDIEKNQLTTLLNDLGKGDT